jgi:hypothetical protein
LIDDLRWVSLEIGVTPRRVFDGRTGGMAIIAAGDGVHQVTSEADQSYILTPQIQRYGSDLKSAPDKAPIIVGPSIIVGSSIIGVDPTNS